ncbi:MAG: hypothetical protein FWD38_02470 [Oscillospiraceae bacterium]|nr:hypothetical protein [Oscillospiraceae bacterium]
MNMKLWQIKAADEMVTLISSHVGIVKYEFKGSLLDHNMLDEYSDVDISFYPTESAAPDSAGLFNAMSERFGKIFGYEVHNNPDNDVYRVCFETGWRFDLSFIYSNENVCPHEKVLPACLIESTVNQFWYISSMTLIKLGRKDNLVAAHLALELCQLVLVVEMQIRDKKMNTNQHRYGYNEDVPVIHALAKLKRSSSENEILDILFLAAENMDTLSMSILNTPGRVKFLKEMQHKLNL